MLKGKSGSKNSVLVIDIGASSLKLLEIDTVKDRPILKKFFIEEFPLDVQEKQSLEKEFLVRYIKETISKNEIRTKKAILILPDEITDLVLLTLPEQTEEELKTSTKWELKDYIPYPVEEACYRNRIIKVFIEKGVPKIRVFVVSVPKREIEKYCEILEEAELEPVSFTVGLTSYGPIIKNSGLIKGDENFIVVDIGARTTVLGVFIEEYLYFYRKADFGGRDITLSLMDENIDFRKAEMLKRDIGILIEDKNEEIATRHLESSRGILEKLIAEIRRCIDFYKEFLKGGQVDKLFVFGGGSKLKGLKPFLSSTLGINIFSPDIFAEIQAGLDSPILTRGYGGFLKDKRFIDLLPEKVKYKQKTKMKHTLIMAGACIFIGIMVLVYTGAFIKGVNLTKELSLNQQAYAKLQPEIDKVEKITQAKQLLQKKMNLCIELLCREPFWEDILKEIGRLIPDNIILTKLDIKIEDGITLALEGRAYPSKNTLERSLSVFLTLISESAFFFDTNLNVTKEGKEGDRIVMDFTIKSKIRPLNIETRK